MLIIPCNNRIVVEEVEQEKEEESETTFLLPEDYSSSDNEKFKIYKFVQAAETCANQYVEGDKLLVESYLVEEAEISGKKVSFGSFHEPRWFGC